MSVVGTGQPGRPSKGSAARKVKGSLWLSQQEVDVMVARFGSSGRALRHLVDDWMRTEPTRKRRGPAVLGSRKTGDATGMLVLPDELQDLGVQAALDQAAQSLGVEAPRGVTPEQIADIYGEPVDFVSDGSGSPMRVVSQETGREVLANHRHRRGPVIRVDFEQGQPKKVYACIECKEELG